MGCTCAGTDTVVHRQNRNSEAQRPSSTIQNENTAHQQRQQGNNRIGVNISQQNNSPQQLNLRSSLSNVEIRRNNQNIHPNYEPYLQSKNDPSFNMKEIPEKIVGEGLKKMKGYICEIEEEDLEKKRKDFWSSRFEGSQEIWELLENLCIGEFSNKDLLELLYASGLTPYDGCINALYDAKGNLYEIPNYCIHKPSLWNIYKLTVLKPKEEFLTLRLRLGIEDYQIKISNLSTIETLKTMLLHKNKTIGNIESNKLSLNSIRLFHRGSELKDKDYIFQYEIFNESLILMMIRSIT